MKGSVPNRVLVIVGPTASGKTTLSLKVAKKIKSEIVSADSRQVYRHLNVGTAKPTPSEIGNIPHHCINIRDPEEFFSAGDYCIITRNIVQEIFSRSCIPIIVGGSGLYIQALLDGIFPGSFRDLSIREKLGQQAEKEGMDKLYSRLSEVDPRAASRIHPNDCKRIIRALEVYELSGLPISKMQREKTRAADFFPVIWGLSWQREKLYSRINERVENMIQEGLVEEVEKVRDMGLDLRINSLDSVGYKEVFQYFDGGLSFKEMVSLIKRNTRRFAKRQITWFRRDSRIQWISLSEPVNWDTIAEEIVIKFIEK